MNSSSSPSRQPALNCPFSGKQAIRSNATKTLHSLQAFIVSLVNATSDGRVLLTRLEAEGNVSLKYMLLAPSEAFRDVVEEARSVILAGGTMKPVCGISAPSSTPGPSSS